MQSSAPIDVITIAIAGCSCSGKSTVARELVASDPHSLVIHQDDYYQKVAPKTEDGLENWDVLESLNIDKLICDVKALVGNPLQHCPKCVTTTTTGAVRSEECIRHAVYIEGTMILDISMLSELLQMKIFITLGYEECLKRRGRHNDPPGFFDGCVWPMYIKREKMSLKDHSVNVVDGRQSKEKILDAIRTLVKHKIRSDI